jgi:ABC-type sugar transport system substrate-binding protein
MKKIATIVLALFITLAFASCHSNDSASETSPPDAGDSAVPGTAAVTASPDSAAETAESTPPASPAQSDLGYFDPDYDYLANPKYEVVYMMNITSVNGDMFSKAFKAWADKANCGYIDFCSNSDNDLFLVTIDTYVNQGMDGFLMDPDVTIYPRIDEVANEYGLNWMPCTGEPRGDDGLLCHPTVGFDNYQYGVDMAGWAIEYAKKTWPEAKPEEIGMLSVGFSLVPQLNDRTIGAKDEFLKEYPDNEANFFTGDGATVNLFNADTAFNLAGPILAGNPSIKYWLICTTHDDYADGAARAAEQVGISQNCVVTTCGGSGLINHWDAGEDSCWKSANYCAQTLYAQPIFFALYAFMSGQATPETIFPEWLDTSGGEKYAYLKLPSFFIEKDNYREYMEWVDVYTGINWSPYDDEYTGTQYD